MSNITEDVVLVEETSTQSQNRTGIAYRVVKRCFDFIASLVASVILLIPMAVTALLIALKDHGSPFYMQKRIGQYGRPLKILKFRSMKVGADNLEEMLTPEQLEEYKREFKLKDDPRLIGYKNPGDGQNCFGAKTRRSSIDELPQILWNICIKGNMSVVGPRPILLEEIHTYYSAEEQERFLSVKPGLTGYWQAFARNDATYESGSRQEMEMYYVENQSIWLDLKIIFKTVGTVIHKKGAN